MARLRWFVASFVLLLSGLVSVPPAEGQWMKKPPAADSPYWWTLTDAITPAELRAALQSRQRNRQRLEQAIEDGDYPALPESRIQQISLFIDGTRDPDLIPMWDAFAILAIHLEPSEGDEEAKLRKGLADYGLSPEAIDAVVAAGYTYPDRRLAVIAEVDREQREFAREVARVEDKLGKKAAAEVIVRQDFDRLARETGMPRGRVADLFETWLRDPRAEASIEGLEGLRALLSPSDWEGLRRYLLETIATGMDYVYFNERPLL